MIPLSVRARRGERDSNYWTLLSELTICEILLRDQGTALGFVWTLLHPALMFCVLYGVSRLLIGGQGEGFAGYLLSGLVLWNLAQKATGYSVSCMRRNRPIILGFRFRREIVVFSTVAAVAWSSILETLLLMCLLPLLGHPPGVRWLLVPLAFGAALLFVAGVSLVLSRLAADLADMERVWDILVSALFYATPVFYRVEAAGDGVRAAIALNPMTHFLEVFRSVLLEGHPASVRSWILCMTAAATAMLAGLVCMRRKEREIAERVMC